MLLGIMSYAFAVPPPANLVIVTRNGAASNVMELLKLSGYNLILVKPEQAKKEPEQAKKEPNSVSDLTKHAHLVWYYTDFIRGIGPSYRKVNVCDIFALIYFEFIYFKKKALNFFIFNRVNCFNS
jgi:hypothetical protein